jgi:hypothetical protein
MNAGKIYKLICNKTNNVYYGSTSQSLMKRRDNHRQQYKQYLKGKCNFITSFEIIKDDDFIIELVESIEFNDKKELIARERYYIQNNDCVNKYIPSRTHKEYYIEHKEHFNQKGKEHYQNNKDQYRKNQKKWAIDHPDKVKQYRKKYKSSLGLFICECGLSCKNSKWDIERHKNTKKHLSLI